MIYECLGDDYNLSDGFAEVKLIGKSSSCARSVADIGDYGLPILCVVKFS